MTPVRTRAAAPVESVEARCFRIPTPQPESDGTFAWDATTLIYVEIAAGGRTGIGYTYAAPAAASIVRDLLREKIAGRDALQTAARHADLYAAVRNNGRTGIASMAISAVDVALWDLKAKLLDVPACTLLGNARESVPLYGSGGFTSYTLGELVRAMSAWVETRGIPRVKMKVGRQPERDLERVAAVRRAIGDETALFVDANGAYAEKQALEFAHRFAEQKVCWFEEPVDHRDLRGNAAVRRGTPVGMDVSNGEYGFVPDEFDRLIEAGAADVVQADVTRCGGFTGFAIVDALCTARGIPLSSHCAPYATLHAALAARTLRHVEYFADHVRIEQLFFDGASDPRDGTLRADYARPGIGLELKRADAERFAL